MLMRLMITSTEFGFPDSDLLRERMTTFPAKSSAP